MKTFKSSWEYKAVVRTRELGGDTVEEFEAFREAYRERLRVSAEVNALFEVRGWK